MKILHLIPHYLPSTVFGGTPHSTHFMVAEQVKQGHQVDVLTTDVHSPEETKPLTQEHHPSGYHIFRASNLSNNFAHTMKFHLVPSAVSFLWRHLPEYDIVHFHEYRTTLNVIAAVLKWRTRATYILQPHGLYLNFGGRRWVKDAFDRCFASFINTSVDEVVAICQKEMQQLSAHFPSDNLHLVYHGITRPGRLVRIKSKYGKGNAVIQEYSRCTLPKRFILFIGRLHRLKRVDFLLKAYAQSGLARRQVGLVIAGNDEGELRKLKQLARHLHLDGSDYAATSALASVSPRASTPAQNSTGTSVAGVHFLDSVDDVSKSILYRNALVTAYVTQDEPLGRVPLEAAMHGCWSIIARGSGVAELTNIANFADVITGKSIREFASCLNKVIKTKKKVPRVEQQKLAQLSWAKQTYLLKLIYEQSRTNEVRVRYATMGVR